MADDSNGNGVRITNREIYDGLMEVKTKLQALESKVEAVLLENVDLRKRVRALELKSYGIIAGLIGAVVVLFKMKGVPL